MIGNDKVLEELYIQSLDSDIITYLAKTVGVEFREAMDIYYKSLLCEQVHSGQNGIQYLDYKYLVEDLIENEKDLFI